jgi:hypothetical protein
VVSAINANNPNLYSIDSIKTDTVFSFNSGVRIMNGVPAAYSDTMPNNYSKYLVDFQIRHLQGSYDFSIDTNYASLFYAFGANSQSTIDSAILFNKIVLNMGSILDFILTNPLNGGSYEFSYKINHVIDTIFVTSTITRLLKHQIHNISGFEIFPNPAKHIIHIKGEVNKSNYKIYNLSGRAIKQGVLEEGIIELSELEPGYYVLRVEKEGNSSSQSLIIE